MAASSLYVQKESGTYIPPSQRPDGTWRKARRVKDGYVPQEEMPLYESKGKQWAKMRPTIPGLDPLSVFEPSGSDAKSSHRRIPGLSEAVEPSLKQAAPKKKKKKKSFSEKDEELAQDFETLTVSQEFKEKSESTKPQVATDPLKRLRNLRKKLKDINSLQKKIESGELANPEKDQLEKVARRTKVEAEIEELEFEILDNK